MDRQDELISDQEADAVQALKCLLDLGHDWGNHDRCDYCGKAKP